MTRKEWYIDRILWKAKQHKLSIGVTRDQILLIGKIDIVHLGDVNIDAFDEILLLFISLEEKSFTYLTFENIVSYHDGGFFCLKLDDIDKKITIDQKEIVIENIKLDAKYLCIGKNQLPIWTPDSNVLFSLMNILRMFPLKEQK